MESILNKCMILNHEEYELYCEDCNTPICKKCTRIHNKHSILDINDKNDEMINNIKGSVDEYKSEVEFLNNNLKDIEMQFNDTQLESKNKIESIKQLFKKLHTLLSTEENSLILQINTIQEENSDNYVHISSMIQNKIDIYNNLINTVNNDKQIKPNCIDLNKYIQQIKQINKDIVPFNYNIQPFKHIVLNKKDNDKDILNHGGIHLKIGSIIKDYISINHISKLIILKDQTKPIKLIDNLNIVQIKSTIDLQLKQVNKYVLYNSSLLSISNIYDFLPLGDEKISSLNTFYIHDLLNDKTNKDIFKKGIIPNNISILYIFNIHQILVYGSIPSSVQYLYIHDGYKHRLVKGVIPHGVYSLSLYDIQQPLEIGSIPLSVKILMIRDRFRHKLSKDIIPTSVEWLSLGGFQVTNKMSLLIDVDSIPSSVKYLHFQDGFGHKLVKGLIPSSVKSLSLFNIREPLEIDSIPSSVKTLSIHNGFKHKLSCGIIPNGVEELYIYDIVQPLDIDSIPPSVNFIKVRSLSILNKCKLPVGVEVSQLK